MDYGKSICLEAGDPGERCGFCEVVWGMCVVLMRVCLSRPPHQKPDLYPRSSAPWSSKFSLICNIVLCPSTVLCFMAHSCSTLSGALNE